MFEQVGNEIFSIEVISTESQSEVTIKSFHCWATRLSIAGNNRAIVDTANPITVEYQDWQGNALPDENHQIVVTVSGGRQRQELLLTPVNGVAEFDFISAVPGTFTIRVSAVGYPCEIGEMEVVVS